jgi:hypothetical protein
MGNECTLQMEIGYAEDGVSLTVKVDATPNQEKSREIRLNVHKKIATELETKLKSIFPPPEAAISVKGQALIAS